MIQRRHRVSSLVVATTLIALGMAAAPATRAGSTIQVDVQSAGIGVAGCTLSEAILAANQDDSTVTFDAGPPSPRTQVETGCPAGSGDDVIVVEPGVYPFTQPFSDPGSHLGPAALPMIRSAITIEGAGAVLQRSTSASDDFRLFSVGPDGDLDLREVDVRGFTAQGGRGAQGGGGGMGAGGAIFVDGGGLRVQWSTFEGNVATGGAGGIISDPPSAGGGGGGIGGSGSYGSLGGGGGGGARGNGGPSLAHDGGGGGGTRTDGGFQGLFINPTVGGYLCGGGGNDIDQGGTADGFDAYCAGGGGGGGADGIILTGDGGASDFGGGGGGGATGGGDGGHGGFGGGGGAAGTDAADDGGDGGDAGFGGGGGAGPGGKFSGEPGAGGTFGGHASDLSGGGGAGLGGAIFAYHSNMIISNSTFTGNAAVRGLAGGPGANNGSDAGGAIFAVGGSTTVVNATISGNESTGDGAGLTVYRPEGESGSLSLSNTIIFGNTGRDECFVRNGVSTSGARNLIATHVTDAQDPCPAVYLRSDPQLGALTLNAPGRTPTMALAPTSPAIDEALDTAAPLDDQRGIPRPQGDYPDIGAYELVGGGPPPDRTGPTAAPTAAPAANANGWNKAAVTVTWHWADEAGGSGLDTSRCPASTTSTGEGADLVVAATCYDLAGNPGNGSVSVDVDVTAPGAAPSQSPAANGAGWNRSDVTVTWQWTDKAGGAGLDAARCAATSTSTGEGENLVVGGTCYDRADNAGSGNVTVDVDKTAPGVTCRATPVYTLRGDHSTNVTATVSDGLSGPVDSTVSADVTATDIAVAGPGSKSLTGADLAGNQTTVSCPYLVKYAFLGFQQPLPATSIKRGSSLPVKFRLGDATGATIPDATAAAMAAACLVQVTFDGVIQGCATYDPVANTFQLDVKTSRNLAEGQHLAGIRVRVAGGTVVNTDQIAVQVKR